ncbi:MAG: class I SAM-dependent methyltransferase, partial [Desulfocapsaceae bacterium]|nr:class I SAM-dependent methyltransferase [Desulfocapsaceae bacterium]
MADNQNITLYDDIDWHLLWKNSRETKSWKSKDSGEWTKKSASFAQRTRHSPYVKQFLDCITVDKDTTLLDVGCGPGTLAVPFAHKVSRVTAIDYSEAMLEQLEVYAE